MLLITKFICNLTMNNICLATAALVLAAGTILRSKPWLHPETMLLSWLHAIAPTHLFLGAAALLPAGAAARYLTDHPRRRAVYLIDYACFRASSSHRIPISTFIEHAKLVPFLDGRSVHFMARMLERSGIGSETSLPPADHYIPPYCSLEEARAEAELVIFTAIDELFAKTGMNPSIVDILIVNCSVFCPVPSLADMVVNRYRLRDGVRCVNLSGMGRSAGVISVVGLASSLLRAAPRGSHALVVSTETITSNFYVGRERAMQLSNILFRMGGAAVLLSTASTRARFRLRHVVRTITGAMDSSYRCIFKEEDGEGNIGFNLSKDLLAVAGDALTATITAVGPLVLPLSEQLPFALAFIAGKISNGRVRLCRPDFRAAFEHFFIHAGGRAVIDKVQRSLGLSDQHVEPSRMSLYRFGNTSSSSLWYELAYMETMGRMRKGDRVWMLGFGSGFKCNRAAWECLRPATQPDTAWAECIHRYPVSIPEVSAGNAR